MATFNAPVVPHFLAGTGPAATDMDTLVYQTMSFLQNRIVLRVSQTTTATTLPSAGTQTTIAFDTVLEDPYSGWNSGTHSWTPPEGYVGWYDFTFTLRTVTVANLVDLSGVIIAAGTAYDVSIKQGQSNAGAGVYASVTAYLVGGEPSASCAGRLLNSGVNISTSLVAGQNSTFEITWISS
jgi:hypothetical protein